jgi:hypothetical protein
MAITKRQTLSPARGFRPWATLSTLVLLLAQFVFSQQSKPPAEVFSSALVQLRRQTRLTILLPDHLPPLAEKSVYARASADEGSYSIRLESDPDCDGANACFLGIFRAKRNGHFSYPESLAIAVTNAGDPAPARYKSTSCGGSCSSPAIEWKWKGILYTVQLTLPSESEAKARSLMIELAQSSLAAGPR